jgi:beta-glucosidase/6-phospho-beta-glucosidase/beta-galactosidase
MVAAELCREKFGVHAVDLEDPSRPRTPKASADYLRQLAQANAFFPSNTPCTNA